MLNDDLNNFLKEECGDAEIGIASADDISSEDMNLVIKTNEIMSKYTPLITSETPVVHPRAFLEEAKTIIVLGINYFFGRKELPGNPPRSEIMNFYVNQDCVDYTAGQSEKIVGFLEQNGYTGVGAAYGTPIKTITARSSLGRYGKNGVIQSPTMGSWLGILLIVTDAPLEIAPPLEDACGDCTKCRDACPTGALEKPYTCDIEKCLTLHMIYNKGEIPNDIREKAGTVIGQCNICIDVCPKNENLTLQKDVPVPEDLVYPEIAPLVNMTDKFYDDAYGESFLEFTMVDKKYLQRNAAIALGNYGDEYYIPELVKALETQEEELIRTSSAWALGKIGSKGAKTALEKILPDETSQAVRSEIEAAMDRIEKS
ncbi:epoxyqueuosine reductase [Spirochaetota bacterium]